MRGSITENNHKVSEKERAEGWLTFRKFLPFGGRAAGLEPATS